MTSLCQNTLTYEPHRLWGGFPWSIPALVAGITGSSDAGIGSLSIFIVLLTSAFGLIATILWWQYADHS